MSDDLYFRAGDWITCEDGHLNWRALSDIRRGDIPRSAEFVDLDGNHPATGQPLAPMKCRDCGGVLFVDKPGGGVVTPWVRRADAQAPA